MRPNVRTFLITTLGLLILAGGLVLERVYAQTPTPFARDENSSQTNKTITVSGTGRASAPPDRAVVRVGIRTEAGTASQALAQNNEQMRSLLDTLRGEGIAAGEMQTQTIQIYPRYADQFQAGAEPRLTGYVAVNMLEVQVSRIENLGTLLDASVQAGANAIEGIRFEISNPSSLYEQARRQAVENGVQKARHLASLIDAEISDVIEIREEMVPIPFERGVMAAGGAGVPIEPGAQVVEITVHITWRLR